MVLLVVPSALSILLLIQSAGVSRKTRLLTVKYNASNNELVRTNTLVKNCIVQIDATPFRQWYRQHYGTEIVTKGDKKVLYAFSPHLPPRVPHSPNGPSPLRGRVEPRDLSFGDSPICV